MDFVLDSRLEADTLPVHDLPLAAVRLMNDARYPWLVLVPRRPGVVEVLDLAEPDQESLWREVRLCARALREVVTPDKLNIATLGNAVPQLHVHVIARMRGDDAWPRPVWGVHPPLPWGPGEAKALVTRIREAITRTPAAPAPPRTPGGGSPAGWPGGRPG